LKLKRDEPLSNFAFKINLCRCIKGGEGGKLLAVMRMELSAGGAAVAWVPVETTGPTPSARRGASVTVLGDLLVVFGGEDAVLGGGGRYLDDAHALDLTTMTWSAVGAGAAGAGAGAGAAGAGAAGKKSAVPTRRAEHTAAAW